MNTSAPLKWRYFKTLQCRPEDKLSPSSKNKKCNGRFSCRANIAVDKGTDDARLSLPAITAWFEEKMTTRFADHQQEYHPALLITYALRQSTDIHVLIVTQGRLKKVKQPALFPDVPQIPDNCPLTSKRHLPSILNADQLPMHPGFVLIIGKRLPVLD